MVRITTFAVATLNQWAMDFRGNYDRIRASIIEAKAKGAKYRSGPELEVTGYGCEDHFYEDDTYIHSLEVLANLLSDEECRGIIVDLGMPVKYKDNLYNCRVVFLDGKILLIRPKTFHRDYGNYRETRWFTAWTKLRDVEEFHSPQMIQEVTKQGTVPFGDAKIATRDALIGYEQFREFKDPGTNSFPTDMDVEDVEVIANSTVEYYELGKSDILGPLIKSRTNENGGIYLYSNLRGCDGGTVYYNGMSSVSINGKFMATSQQFSLRETEVSVATVDLDDVKRFRRRSSFNPLPETSETCPEIKVDFALCDPTVVSSLSVPVTLKKYSPEEQMCMGSACWLWDYLRRSGHAGFFLPLSGGIDSSSCAAVVYAMSSMVCDAVKAGDIQVMVDVRKIAEDSVYNPVEPKELCNEILVTSYFETENSSEETLSRAIAVAADIGSYHISVNIDPVVTTSIDLFESATGKHPKFKSQGGTNTESLALQNIQARQRMVLSYLFAQLDPRERKRPTRLLVLGTGNADEGIIGYCTKYDCSSADINPIGSLSKSDLKAFLLYAAETYKLDSLTAVAAATPTPELEPLEGGKQNQTDEEDIGLTYEEIGTLGSLRKPGRCGPFSMFSKLIEYEAWRKNPREAAEKVKHFFGRYAVHRHKMSTMTPSFQAKSSSCDDHRNDHRQLLYNTQWEWQFTAIDDKLKSIGEKSTSEEKET